jgi:hypothetical protein
MEFCMPKFHQWSLNHRNRLVEIPALSQQLHRHRRLEHQVRQYHQHLCLHLDRLLLLRQEWRHRLHPQQTAASRVALDALLKNTGAALWIQHELPRMRS